MSRGKNAQFGEGLNEAEHTQLTASVDSINDEKRILRRPMSFTSPRQACGSQPESSSRKYYVGWTSTPYPYHINSSDTREHPLTKACSLLSRVCSSQRLRRRIVLEYR